MEEYLNRKYTLNCSPEAKKFIDNYMTMNNLNQREAIDYLCTLANNSLKKEKTTDNVKEIKQIELLLKSYSEKAYEILIRVLMICVMINGTDFDQEKVKEKASSLAKKYSEEIFNIATKSKEKNLDSKSEVKTNQKPPTSTLSEKEKDIFGVKNGKNIPSSIPALYGDINGKK